MDQFFLKLGTLLTMTKDTLLEDFLGDLPQYAPDKFIDPSPIKFYADTISYDWFKGNDLMDLWDGGVNHTTLDQIPETVNQTIFWAGSVLATLPLLSSGTRSSRTSMRTRR